MIAGLRRPRGERRYLTPEIWEERQNGAEGRPVFVPGANSSLPKEKEMVAKSTLMEDFRRIV